MKNMYRCPSKPRLLALLGLLFAIGAGHSPAQAPPNLLVDSLTGEVSQHEVDTFIGYTTPLVPPTAVNGDDMSYGTSGNTLESFNYMYGITGDIPSLAVEHTQLLNLAIKWTDDFIRLRNDQPLGLKRVMWTGQVEPVWTTKAAGVTNEGYAGSENGDIAGHIVFTALNILQTPSLWSSVVPDGDPNHFGATYLARAQTYIAMMEVTTQTYFTKQFINTSTFQIVPPASAAWVQENENMDAWNRQFLFTYVYLRLAQVHALLGDNSALQSLYTNVVKTSTDAFVANARPVTGARGQAAFDWGYGNEGDIVGQITGESSSHASYSMEALPRIFEAGPAYSSTSLETMERYANTINSVLWNQGMGLNAGYYKSIDSGLPPLSNPPPATQDYLYPQFYVLTPYNTQFWAAAATAAGPTIRNNYHNNPYLTEQILYSKHWVFNHPQTLVSVASNAQTVASGATATFSITTNSSAPVVLSLSGLPAGATASFNPATVPAGSGASVLTITTSTAAVNGSTLLTLTGTSGTSIEHLPLSVATTASDFTISLPPGALSNAVGSTSTTTVTVAPVNGFKGDVTLSSGYFPPATVTTYNPTVITGGAGTSMATIATSATDTPGAAWPFAIIGTSGNISHAVYSRINVNGATQTINFPPLANVTYGTAPVALLATAGSILPPTYTVTGPAKIAGDYTLLGQPLVISGVGTVTVTANQAGNKFYAAAPAVVHSFTVSRAALTVAAQNLSVPYNTALPPLRSTTTGFVNSDTSAVVTGAPVLATTATATSPAGAYPITIALGTLAAANYTFSLANATLTITPATSTTALAVTPASTSAGQLVTLTATVKSSAGTPTGTVAFLNGGATVGSAPVNAQGVAVFTSTTLAGGNYSITAVYGGDNNFATSMSGASVLAVSDYTLTAASSTLTIKSGDSGTAAITLTPIANYKGAVPLSCGQLPANVNCIFSNITPTLDGTGSPVAVTLTIATNGFVTRLQPEPHANSQIVSASLFFLPAGLGGLLLAFGRRAVRHRTRVMLLVFFLSIGLAGLAACGAGTADAAAGMTTITVTGAGTVSHTLNLAVTIQ